MNKDELYKILENFYKAIEKNLDFGFERTSVRLVKPDLQGFPKAKCRDISEILKCFLLKEYELEFKNYQIKYCSGPSDEACSNEHYYLKNEDYLIDLTASQFNDSTMEIFKNRMYKFEKIILLSKEEIREYFFEKIASSKIEYLEKHFFTEEIFFNINDFYDKLVEDYNSL